MKGNRRDDARHQSQAAAVARGRGENSARTGTAPRSSVGRWARAAAAEQPDRVADRAHLVHRHPGRHLTVAPVGERPCDRSG
jgi:hypothetical protein